MEDEAADEWVALMRKDAKVRWKLTEQAERKLLNRLDLLNYHWDNQLKNWDDEEVEEGDEEEEEQEQEQEQGDDEEDEEEDESETEENTRQMMRKSVNRKFEETQSEPSTPW
eukprot:GHVU01040700.1.p4 GENE.GHVU01040700.1~~GHVU01040700.1.p4  ORF type:complete len:112 (+),score=44.45 GHVU01040700.1:230-565(+)